MPAASSVKAQRGASVPGVLSAAEINKIIENDAIVLYDLEAVAKIFTWDGN